MALFGKPKYSAIKVKKVQIPTGRWMKCTNCREIIDAKAFETAFKTCPKCKFHYRMTAWEWVDLLLDKETFEEMDRGMLPMDPLGFVDSKKYTDRQEEAKQRTELNEAIVTGMAGIAGHCVGFGAMDFSYIGGSMGSVVGEKVTRLTERCLDQRCVLIIITASGGARMMESTYSLMQMAKTAGALSKFHQAGLMYIAILTNPTTGGVTASFASLGDIVIAEPGALIGFAGPRVIEQTIRQELPQGFQRSEFLLEHGMIDIILPRKELPAKLQELVTFFSE
jgi:acetyl-CoA carboxylase carboxyl transferase subunit beta